MSEKCRPCLLGCINSVQVKICDRIRAYKGIDPERSRLDRIPAGDVPRGSFVVPQIALLTSCQTFHAKAFKVVIPKIRKAWASLNLRNSLSSTFVAKLGGDGRFVKFMPGVAGGLSDKRVLSIKSLTIPHGFTRTTLRRLADAARTSELTNSPISALLCSPCP
jgi:hypothetical protein